MARLSSRWLLRGGIGHLGLNRTEGLVLLALLDHIDKAGVAWCPQTHLARDLRIARSQINLAQARLREMGVLVEHEPGRQGRATRYRFADTKDLEHVAIQDMLGASNMSGSRGISNVVDMSQYRTGG